MKKVKSTIAAILAIIMIVSLSLSLTGCQKGEVKDQTASPSAQASETAPTSSSPSPEKTGTVITDSRGKTIEIAYPVDSIVCLLNSALNDLYMLGAADKVVGIDEWTYSNEMTYNILSKIDTRIANKEIPAVDANVEKIISLDPDAVIIWANDTEKINALESHGIKVIGIQVNNFDDVFTKLRMVAQLVDKGDRAEEIINYTQDTLKSVSDTTDKLSDTDKKTGIFVWGGSKLDLAGSKSTGHSILELCGLTDSAAGIPEEHFVAKMEDVIQWNPDTIMMWNIADLDPQDYIDDTQWANVTAITDKAVYEIPDGMTFYCDMWTVKYIYAAQYFAKCAYPELFKDVDMDAFKDDMMTALYGKTIA